MATVQVAGVVSGRGVFWKPGKTKTNFPHIQVMENIPSPVPGARDIRIWTCRLSPAADRDLLPYLRGMTWVCVVGQLLVVPVQGGVNLVLTRCIVQLGPEHTIKDNPVFQTLTERKHFSAPKTEKTSGDQVDAVELEEEASLLPG